MASTIRPVKSVSQQLGHAAETLAIRYFARRGFSVVARNHRYRRGEVDVIVQKDHLLVFVEVKARSGVQFGYPETFMSPRQQDLVRQVATQYVFSCNWKGEIRFDIIAILKVRGCQLQLTHFEDAF